MNPKCCNCSHSLYSIINPSSSLPNILEIGLPLDALSANDFPSSLLNEVLTSDSIKMSKDLSLRGPFEQRKPVSICHSLSLSYSLNDFDASDTADNTKEKKDLENFGDGYQNKTGRKTKLHKENIVRSLKTKSKYYLDVLTASTLQKIRYDNGN